MAKKSSLSFLVNMIPRGLQPQHRDMESIALWGVASVVGIFWLIQPWDWLSEKICGPEDKNPLSPSSSFRSNSL
uniref:Uncharacterized protein n=1 Tax=Physcomitrium patens TaxID=3218 RepID=A0A2K1L983_PHYPA|nr:hypothetical protein PHYPA_001020 [Physcomitrium patens]